MNVGQGRFTTPQRLVLPDEDLRQLTPGLRFSQLRGYKSVALQVKWRTVIERGNAAEVIQVIDEKGTRLRHASVGNTVTFHRATIVHCRADCHNTPGLGTEKP